MAMPSYPTKPVFLGRLGSGSTFASAYRRAKEANEKRYQEILAGYQRRQAEVMGEIGKLGAGNEAAYGEAQRKNLATLRQEAVNSGMPLASVFTSSRAAARRKEADVGYQQGLSNVAGMRAQSLAGLSGDTLQFMERRTDAYPDANLFASLYGQQGYGQGAQGRSGSGSRTGSYRHRWATWPSQRR